jgi:hypothetical protein
MSDNRILHEFSTVPTEGEKMHEDRALRLMRELRSMPPRERPTWYRLVPDWGDYRPACSNGCPPFTACSNAACPLFVCVS